MANSVDSVEIERVRAALVRSIELLSVEALVYVLLSPHRAVLVAGRVSSVLWRLRRLVIACESALLAYVTNERRVFGEFQNLKLPLVANSVWAADAGSSSRAVAPTNLLQIAARLRALSNTGQPLVRIESYDRAGSKQFIVYIPGTQNLSPILNQNPLDMRSNLQLMAGESSTSSRAVALAMRRAQIGPTDSVMLVGHSQGGLIAADLAARAGSGQLQFKIDHVVTFGAPLGLKDPTKLPNTVSIENTADLVPKLDLKANSKTDSWQTLHGTREADLVESHRMESYELILAKKQASGELNSAKINEIAQFAHGIAKVQQFELGQR